MLVSGAISSISDQYAVLRVQLMKIIQVSTSNLEMPLEEGKGPQTVIFNISKQLAGMGHEVTVIGKSNYKAGQHIECIDGIRIVRLRTRKFPTYSLPRIMQPLFFLLAEVNNILYALAVSRYLKEYKRDIDVIHVHLTSLGILLSLLNKGLRKRMLYTCHVGNWVLPVNKLNLLERITLFLDAWLMRRVRRVTAFDDVAKDQFIYRGRVKVKNVVVISNGVDTELYNPSIQVEDIPQRYGLEGKIVVLFVGWRIKIKGIEFLIKAADIIVNELGYRDVLFLLIAPSRPRGIDEPVDMESLLAFITQRQLDNNIKFIDRVPIQELRKLYVASDIFVLSSLAEGDPLVVLEAMASGKPIVGTKVGGIPQKVKDGWNGFLVDPGNEQQLADKIKYLIDNPDERQRMGKNSRKHAEEEFDWKKVAERLSLAYSVK